MKPRKPSKISPDAYIKNLVDQLMALDSDIDEIKAEIKKLEGMKVEPGSDEEAERDEDIDILEKQLMKMVNQGTHLEKMIRKNTDKPKKTEKPIKTEKPKRIPTKGRREGVKALEQEAEKRLKNFERKN